MYCEVPKLQRCCCCLPLRHGILAFGYLYFALSLTILVITCIQTKDVNEHGGMDLPLYYDSPNLRLNVDNKNVTSVYRGLAVYSHAAIPISLNVVEVIFNLMLIVGAHMKNMKIILIYFYYSVCTILAVIVASFTIMYDEYFYFVSANKWLLVIIGEVVHCYLLLMIWSELAKLKLQGESYRFENHAASDLKQDADDDQRIV